MEGLFGTADSETERVSMIERRVEAMKPFFSENTTITAKDERNFQVETILDQDVCDGGQKVKLDLTLKRENRESYMSDDDPRLEIKPYVTFLVNMFNVNGDELTSKKTPIYLSSYDEEFKLELLDDEDRQKVMEYLEKNENDSYFSSRFGTTQNGSISASRLKNGDDIAIFFHEKGHLLREDGDLGYYDQGDGDDKVLALKDIFEERRASIKALRLLKEHPSFFPKDIDYIKVKLRLSISLSSYIKEATYNGRVSLGDEATRIVDFDQDWHY